MIEPPAVRLEAVSLPWEPTGSVLHEMAQCINYDCEGSFMGNYSIYRAEATSWIRSSLPSLGTHMVCPTYTHEMAQCINYDCEGSFMGNYSIYRAEATSWIRSSLPSLGTHRVCPTYTHEMAQCINYDCRFIHAKLHHI